MSTLGFGGSQAWTRRSPQGLVQYERYTAAFYSQRHNELGSLERGSHVLEATTERSRE